MCQVPRQELMQVQTACPLSQPSCGELGLGREHAPDLGHEHGRLLVQDLHIVQASSQYS